MKIRSAHYLRQLPTKIAVVLPDGRAKITDLTPIRVVTESELSDLAALQHPAYRREMLKDAMPDYALNLYGFELVPES